MSTQAPPGKYSILVNVLGVAALVVLAAIAGLWLGERSVRDDPPPQGAQRVRAPRAPIAQGPEQLQAARGIAPVYVHIQSGPDDDWSIAEEEIAMAARAGVHRYIVTLPAPWQGETGNANLLAPLERIGAIDPLAQFLVEVNLNPPPTWMRTHGGDVVHVDGEAHIYPSMGSRIWLQSAQQALTALAGKLAESPYEHQVEGYLLAALEDGRWQRSAGYDASPANREAFRAWLGRRYGSDDALAEAWGRPGLTFETVDIPAPPEETGPMQVFFDLESERDQVDFLRFVSESTADNIAALSAHLKAIHAEPTRVFAHYGHSFELTANDAGHFALGAIIQSDIDGFVSPVSYIERGLGGVGGAMGPINSAQYHGKDWILIDDTRTGIARNPATGVIERMRAVRAEDVFNVQRRNFAFALIHGLGICWVDPQGQGWLHDEEQWALFANMKQVYETVAHETAERAAQLAMAPPPDLPNEAPEPVNESGQDSEEAVEDEDASGGETTADSAPADRDDVEDAAPMEDEDWFALDEDTAENAFHPITTPRPGFNPSLLVVIDEQSRFYQKSANPLNELLLHQARDAALRAGVSTQFALLQDVLDYRAPTAGAYLFLNAFKLSEAERETLHNRLAAEAGAAIWMYAPGYIAEEAAIENISATTRMQVRRFRNKLTSGSQFQLAGAWKNENEEFGQARDWDPLFYIEDPQVDVVARYKASNEASVAVRFLDDWTSIYVAEPALTAALLRELLELLEQHVFFRATAQKHFDAFHMGNNLLAVHSRKGGDRVLDLGQYCDVSDVLNEAFGWTQRFTFVLPMNAGDTRIFRLTPLSAARLQLGGAR